MGDEGSTKTLELVPQLLSELTGELVLFGSVSVKNVGGHASNDDEASTPSHSIGDASPSA